MAKYLLVLLALFTLFYAFPTAASTATKAGDKCISIDGEYRQWNGWPPFERIETTDKKKVYGLVSSFEGDDVPQFPEPDSLKLVWAAHEVAVGVFEFCLHGGQSKVPYDERPIELGWIKSFTPRNSSAQADFVRQLKIAVIRVRTRGSNPHKLGHVEVSFDYKDGNISNARIDEDESNGDADLNQAALSDVTKATLPACPSALKGMTLHVVLPLYFPPDG